MCRRGRESGEPLVDGSRPQGETQNPKTRQRNSTTKLSRTLRTSLHISRHVLVCVLVVYSIYIYEVYIT